MDLLSTPRHQTIRPQNIKELSMIRGLFFFLILFVIFFIGIKGFFKLSGKEKLQLTETVIYSILCSVVAMFVIAATVVLF